MSRNRLDGVSKGNFEKKTKKCGWTEQNLDQENGYAMKSKSRKNSGRILCDVDSVPLIKSLSRGEVLKPYFPCDPIGLKQYRTERPAGFLEIFQKKLYFWKSSNRTSIVHRRPNTVHRRRGGFFCP